MLMGQFRQIFICLQCFFYTVLMFFAGGPCSCGVPEQGPYQGPVWGPHGGPVPGAQQGAHLSHPPSAQEKGNQSIFTPILSFIQQKNSLLVNHAPPSHGLHVGFPRIYS